MEPNRGKVKASKELLNIREPLTKINDFGVYFLLKDEEVIYVGKSVNGVQRVLNHSSTFYFNFYCFIPLGSRDESKLLEMEAKYIMKYLPKCNGMFGQGYDGGYMSCASFSIKHDFHDPTVRGVIEIEAIQFIQVGRFKKYKETDLLAYSDRYVKKSSHKSRNRV